MAITFFASASTPADNGSNGSNAVTITPPASMVAGDFVFVAVTARTLSSTLAVNVTGGQSWTDGTALSGNGMSSRSFWCQYDGTWDASPSWSSSAGAGSVAVTGLMAVFRPTDGSNTFDIDVAATAANFAAPGGSFDVTIPEITTLTNGAIVIASYNVAAANTWTIQTVGWTHPDSVAQVRNTSGSDSSISMVYQIKTTAGATGDIVNRESADTAGQRRIIAFKEVSAAAATGPKADGDMTAGLRMGFNPPPNLVRR